MGGANNAPLWYSADGGSTWTQESTIPPPPGLTADCPCDQNVDYGANNIVYGTFLHQPNTSVNKFDVVTGDTSNPTRAASWQWLNNPAQLTDNATVGTQANTDQPWVLTNQDTASAIQDDLHV